MEKNQKMLLYYCGQLQSEWARKKALAYLRILAEAEASGQGGENKSKRDNKKECREQLTARR